MKRFVVSLFAIAVAGSLLAYLAKPAFSSRHALSAFVHDLRRNLSLKAYAATDADPPFICWGDSLTYGFGTTFEHSYTDMLANIYHRPTVNEGVPKETSTQIAERMLARSKPGGPESVIIWAGRNNAYEPDRVEADIAKMVASLAPGSRYLVLGVINADIAEEWKGGPAYGRFTKLDADLRAAYGARYVPIRQALISHASRRFVGDQNDLAHDIPPRSLRIDDVHLNDAGQAIVAEAVFDALNANGW